MKIKKILKTIGMLAVIGVSGTITYHLIKKYRNRNEAEEDELESEEEEMTAEGDDMESIS